MACGSQSRHCGGDGSCSEEKENLPTPFLPTAVADLGPCSKCKDNTAMVKSNQNHNEGSALCLPCFRSSLFVKFKLAVTSNGMITPTDKVLVAFSGGSCSRVALEFVHEMQSKAQKNLDASKDRSLPVFSVGVAFVDESIIYHVPSHEVCKIIQEIRSIVSSLGPPAKEIHIVPIEDTCALDSQEGEGKSRFDDLLNSISDATGKEDFLLYLRMVSLLKVAFENGYSKLVLGLCSSRIACHVISATAKGQGYSLPADIQYVDARWGIPVVLPLRDCQAQELAMLCHLDSLKTLQQPENPRFGINALVSSFVARLQEENPSRERTIVRTAEKLTPFSFNKLPESNSPHDPLLFRRRQKLQNLQSDESICSEVLCLICSKPLCEADLEISRSRAENYDKEVGIFSSICCPSCSFQILPKDPSSLDHFYSLLPQVMLRRANRNISSDQSWLRDKIKDCLLSEDDDGT